MVDLLLSLAYGLLVQTNVLSHITRRVVDNFGARGQEQKQESVVVVLNRLPVVPRAATTSVRWEEWLLAPIPGRFMVMGRENDRSCLLGVVLGPSGFSKASVAWMEIDWELPVSTSIPVNGLAALFATLDRGSASFLVRKMDLFGTVDGCTVLGLRD